MSHQTSIPAFGLFGEQGPFPDVIHYEDFSVRAPVHNWKIIPHRHSQMSQLFLVESGWIDAVTDSQRHRVAPGDFLYIPDNCVHEFVFEPGSRGGIFSFPNSIVRPFSSNGSQILTALSTPFGGAADQRLADLTQLLRDTAQEASPFRAQQVLGLAHSVLARLAEAHLPEQDDDDTRRPSRLFALDELISRNRAQGWTAAQYAQALSISTGHLSRLCRRATGMGAAAYIEQRRMEEACRLLAFTQLPVSQVGYRLGYIDPSYFSKRFRAVRGQTPKDYRSRFTS